MILKTRVGLLAGAAALTLTGASYGGPATEGTDQDLAQRLAAAEAKIAAMENANNQNWLTEQRAAEIKGLVQDVLSDADTRSSLLQSGMTSGYDNGMIIGSSDGNWLLRTNFLMQQRFIYNRQDPSGDAGTGFDNNRYGFENTRSKFILSGHVVNPNWFYLVDVNIGTGGGGVGGLGVGDTDFDFTGTGNAYLGYDYGNGWKISVGSMKLPFLREELVDDQYQLAVERSIVNYGFSTGYGDGLSLTFGGDSFRFTGMFSDGANTGQSAWSTGPTVHAEYALTARGEFLLGGTWDQFKDFTSVKGDSNGFLIGAAAHYQKGEFGTALANETEYFALTADISAEFGGFNLFGALIWTDTQEVGGVLGADNNAWGFVIQGGVYLTDTWELFGRFEFQDYDTTLEDYSTITGGVTKYFAGHNAKWTTDIGWGLNEVALPASITGWRSDFGGEDGQLVFRTQWQLYF